MLKRHQKKDPVILFSAYQIYLFGCTQLVDENQGVTYTVQDQDTMLCPKASVIIGCTENCTIAQLMKIIKQK